MPNIDFITISQKIDNKEKKEELIKFIKENLPKGFGAIVRTSAEKASKEDIKKDIDNLLNKWKKIEKEYSEEEALEIGINKVIETIEKKLTKKDTIIDKKVLKKVKNNSTMDIDVFVVVKELISTQKEIEIEKD